VDDEHLYIVTYDIADPRRWRAVFKLMHGYGQWLQLSVFQCRLPRSRYLEMVGRLEATITAADDHVMLVDVGLAEGVQPRVRSLGKRGFEPITREPVIV
jgi:CRISPR-associated protein Cas2